MRIGIHTKQEGNNEIVACDFHFIVQTNSGGWAQKQGTHASEYLGLININNRNWNKNNYVNFYDSETIYLAVTR